MRTLDRYVVRNFLYAALMWFVVLMSLRIVVDLFLNMSSFVKLDLKFYEMCIAIAQYYSYQSLAYIVELGGIIISASAVFTLAWMNHTNELTAMMASGVSLRRVATPIIICAILMAGLVIVDREYVISIPEVADKLIREKDETVSVKDFKVRLARDGDKNVWHSMRYRREDNTISQPVIVIRDKSLQQIARVSGSEAKPYPGTLNGKSGWLITPATSGKDVDKFQVHLVQTTREGNLWQHNPDNKQIFSTRGPAEIYAETQSNPGLKAITDEVNGLTITGTLKLAASAPQTQRGGVLEDPQFTFHMDGREIGTFIASSARWVPSDRGEGFWQLTDGKLFFPSDLDPKDVALRQSSRFMDYLSTSQLNDLLQMQRVPDKKMALLTRHCRITDPINIVVLLLLGLPFILSRERNIKASAGLCLLASGTFYAFIYGVRYFGLPPEWAAWLPVLLFGPLAVAMFDSVKT